MKDYLKYIPVFLLFIFVVSLSTHTNSALNQDLGRHIKLGEMIVKTYSVPSINLFSYTNPKFPFVNHHWLSETIFYLLSTYFGILSISYLKIIIILTSLILIFLTCKKISTINVATMSCFFMAQLLMARSDERPEVFGFLFFSALLTIFFFQKEGKTTHKIVYLAPLILFLWVNTHITFIFGFLLLVLFLANNVILKKGEKAKVWISVSTIALFLSLLNPHGLQGLLYPFSLFKNYGYSIQENQNLFFLNELTSDIYIKIFWIQSLVIIASGSLALFYEISKKTLKDNSIYYLLFAIFFLASIVAIRNFPFFVFISMISFSHFLSKIAFLVSKYTAPYKAVLSILIPIIFSGFIVIAILLISTNAFYNTFDEQKQFEVRIEESYKEGTDFFLKHSLKGPIFNNFDIGGYLDYRLYPKIKVFVDNRPEAYPNKFFDYYKNSLSDLTLTNNLLQRYSIQTIIFSHTDGTPWAQEFIKNTTKLKNYKFVYVDKSIIILSKNSAHSINIMKHLEQLIEKDQKYTSLLSLSNLSSLLGNKELSIKALDKAYRENPSSCAVRLQVGARDVSSDFVFIRSRGIATLKSTWMCPYSKGIRKELKNLFTQFSY